jgi:hypothetical protein
MLMPSTLLLLCVHSHTKHRVAAVALHCNTTGILQAAAAVAAAYAPAVPAPHLAAPAIYYEHVQRKAVCGVEHVSLTNVEAEVTLAAAAAATQKVKTVVSATAYILQDRMYSGLCEPCGTRVTRAVRFVCPVQGKT